MYNKFLFVAFAIFIQGDLISSQRQWVPPTTTAAEMRNPYTWYWPYAIAASEAYNSYFRNAQQISNQLYQQAYATQAFPWAVNQAGGAAGQAGQTAGQAAGQAGQTAGQAGQAAGQAIPNWNGQDQPGWNGQGQQGWNGPGQQGWNGQGQQGWNGQQG